MGQKAIISLAKYPETEYGVIYGVITWISPIPDDGHYEIKIRLSNGLKTTYKKYLEYSPKLSGNAQIIVENMNLFQRFIYPIMSIFKNK